MVKTPSQRVRDAEAARRAKGQKEIRVWVPNTQKAIEAVRKLARKLCGERD